MLADSIAKLVAAIREATDVIGVVNELLVDLLRGHLLGLLLGVRYLSHELLLRILSVHLVALGLANLRLLIHKLVHIIHALYILLVRCLLSSLTSSVLIIIKADITSMICHC